MDMVRKTEEAGVDEIACLLDFGPSSGRILENLKYITELADTFIDRGRIAKTFDRPDFIKLQAFIIKASKWVCN